MHIWQFRRWRPVAALCFLSISAACASKDAGIAVVESTPEASNWPASAIATLEKKVGDLEEENGSLRQRIASLQTRLAAASIGGEEDVPEVPLESPASLRADTTSINSLPKQPVISAPDTTAGEAIEEAPIEATPRLVQPSFASASPVFENEALGTSLTMESVFWGVHLDSFSKESFAREGWQRLQRAFPDELGLLEPRIQSVDIEGRGRIIRLIGGGFTDDATANDLCSALTRKDQFCRVVAFSGQKMSLAGIN